MTSRSVFWNIWIFPSPKILTVWGLVFGVPTSEDKNDGWHIWRVYDLSLREIGSLCTEIWVASKRSLDQPMKRVDRVDPLMAGYWDGGKWNPGMLDRSIMNNWGLTQRFSVEVIHVSVHITGYSPTSDTVQLNIFEHLWTTRSTRTAPTSIVPIEQVQ